MIYEQGIHKNIPKMCKKVQQSKATRTFPPSDSRL